MIFSKKQKEFMKNAIHRYNFKVGARRCGKTYLDSQFTIANRIRERKGKDGLNCIFGVSKGTIERNVLQPMRALWGKKCVGNINNNNIAILFGEEVYCLGCEKVNQVSKIQGTSIKYAYGDEVAKWNKEVFIMIQGSLDKPYSCMDGALNPENKNHWFKKDFLDRVEEEGLDVYVQHYTIFDNPFLSKEFIENLCKEYSGTIYYNRLILGQWCDAEGIIFRMIADNKDRYMIEEADNETGIISIGIDWGGHKSAHTICATRLSYGFNKMEVLESDKLDAEGTDTNQIFGWIVRFVKNIQYKYGAIEAVFPDCAEQVLNNSLRKFFMDNNLFVPVIDCLKPEIKDRIRLLTILFNIDRIKFVKDKTNTIIESLQTAVFDDDADDERWIDDGETSDIDSLDAFCYSWTYWIEQISNLVGG